MAIRTTQNVTPSATTHYVYDRAGQLIAEASGTGTAQREYVWLDDMPLAVVADVDTITPKLWYVHADHLNRPARMTDSTRAVVWNAYYWPYGEVRAITGSASLNLRFPGQYFLVESGLNYSWHRHYDAATGMYMQADPLEFVDGPSVYAYSGSSPMMFIDPEGLSRGFRPAGSGARFPSLGPQYVPRSGGIAPVTAGQRGEANVRQSCRIGEPVAISINGRDRRPDGLTNYTLSEVKNVGYQRLSGQLRDYMDYAKQRNLKFDLYTRGDTYLSRGLIDAYFSNQLNLNIIP
jgi:RHS repeat-associated protein